ncbi:MAG: methyltransferase domain-containing protein [Anaerolineae bacterium]|nr:methyltransferase domain-containing protein [Anaerolineae bacterium]
MIDVFAITTRGLETISAAEMTEFGLRTGQIAYRRIAAQVDDDALASAAGLRTVDDVFLHLAEWPDLPHTRDALAQIAALSARLPLSDALSILQRVRPLVDSPRFSVTANFVGKRNYSVPEIKPIVAEAVMRTFPAWTYAEDDEANLNLRLFIDHTRAVVGLRLFERPLHRRAYKQIHLPGSLKPTVAAAMLRLAGIPPGATVLDPFCGAGTIPIEAAAVGNAALGGDINREGLAAAHENARLAGLPVGFAQWDAARLPLASESVAAVIANLPWGRQIMIDADLRALYEDAFAEMQRVVASGGALVLLTTLPDLLPAAPAEQIEISLFGQMPVIVRFAHSG